MFRVIKYRNVSGKIQATIETDDQTVGDFIRFFGSINKFADLFHYRMRSAKSFDLYQKKTPHKLALLKKEFAEQLYMRHYCSCSLISCKALEVQRGEHDEQRTGGT